MLKTAIVHEWLVNYAGSERCVESFTNIWKDAPVFTLVDFLNEAERKIILKGRRALPSFIQKLPFAKTQHRKYLPLFPFAIEQFDLNAYDLVLSSSHAVAKGVLTNSNQLHICYCYTPMRYAWDLYHVYLKEAGLLSGISGLTAKMILHRLRAWDIISSNRVDHFIAISNHISKRIKKTYNRESVVIYPPVDVHLFECSSDKEEFYLTASRMVSYKRIDIIVDAFTSMPDKKLVVIGDGSEMKKIKAKAGKNVEILGYQEFAVLKSYMQKAKAFIFAAEEDFGIIVVEAMACGTPVIALNIGGASETVNDHKVGVLFSHQTPESVKEAVLKFEAVQDKFDPAYIRNHSLKFGRDIFEDKIKQFIKLKSDEFFSEKK
ncbi:MAG: glycosyltransferase family 4 protein [Ignavibacteriaceae bacterium]|nr:glycosyltransferase family 4 protein [Ignavibacteriaceae bacterium]